MAESGDMRAACRKAPVLAWFRVAERNADNLLSPARRWSGCLRKQRRYEGRTFAGLFRHGHFRRPMAAPGAADGGPGVAVRAWPRRIGRQPGKAACRVTTAMGFQSPWSGLSAPFGNTGRCRIGCDTCLTAGRADSYKPGGQEWLCRQWFMSKLWFKAFRGQAGPRRNLEMPAISKGCGTFNILSCRNTMLKRFAGNAPEISCFARWRGLLRRPRPRPSGSCSRPASRSHPAPRQ